MLPGRLGVILLALALVLPACGSDDEQPASGSVTATPEATETATATPTPTPTATPTQAPAGQALWPDPSAADAPTEPVAVARSFAEDYVGLENPALGEFRQHDPDEGEVDVHRRGEDGREQDAVVAVILLNQQGDRWVITRVTSPEVEIEEPQPGAEITSPVRIAGRGRGFEGNIPLGVSAGGRSGPARQRAGDGGRDGRSRALRSGADLRACGARRGSHPRAHRIRDSGRQRVRRVPRSLRRLTAPSGESAPARRVRRPYDRSPSRRTADEVPD
jgi:hypothetical protein